MPESNGKRKNGKVAKQPEKISDLRDLEVAILRKLHEAERMGSWVEGGEAKHAQILITQCGYVWLQSKDMTREKFMHLSGEVYDFCEKHLEKYRANKALRTGGSKSKEKAAEQ